MYMYIIVIFLLFVMIVLLYFVCFLLFKEFYSCFNEVSMGVVVII